MNFNFHRYLLAQGFFLLTFTHNQLNSKIFVLKTQSYKGIALTFIVQIAKDRVAQWWSRHSLVLQYTVHISVWQSFAKTSSTKQFVGWNWQHLSFSYFFLYVSYILWNVQRNLPVMQCVFSLNFANLGINQNYTSHTT